jgi:hypothetical protein
MSPGLDPDDDIGTAEGLHIRGGFFQAFILGHDARRGFGHALLDKARLSPDLDRAQRGSDSATKMVARASRRRCRALAFCCYP